MHVRKILHVRRQAEWFVIFYVGHGPSLPTQRECGGTPEVPSHSDRAFAQHSPSEQELQG